MKYELNSLIGQITEADCEEVLAQLPDKCVNLVLADPPYGIDYGRAGGFCASHGWGPWRENVSWDEARPSAEFFSSIQRVGQNQIVWGGNYFTDFLPPSMGWFFWDKGQRDFSLADGELAWSSFRRALRVFSHSRAAARVEGKCHPTQKPVPLYMWLIKLLTKENDIILDPMSGSGTTALACHALNRRFICIEREHKYVEVSRNRLRDAQAQMSLFPNSAKTESYGSAENSLQHGQPEMAEAQISMDLL